MKDLIMVGLTIVAVWLTALLVDAADQPKHSETVVEDR